MRVTTNILTEDLQQPSSAHRFWTAISAAVVLADSTDPAALAAAVAKVAAPSWDQLRDLGSQLPAKFTGGASAASTRDVYYKAAERKEH
jgi:hypothetical protein